MMIVVMAIVVMMLAVGDGDCDGASNEHESEDLHAD